MFELKDYLALLRRWWWFLLLSTIIAVGASYYFTRQQTPVYRATTTLIVGQSIDTVNLNRNDLYISTLIAQTYVEVGRQQPVMQATVESLALSISWQALRNQVTLEPVSNTQLLQITAQAESLAQAKIIADEVANQLILLSPTSQQNQENSENYQFVQTQLEQLIPKIEGGQARVAELEALMAGTLSAEQVENIQGEINTLEKLIADWENKYIQLLSFSEEQRSPNYLAVTEPAQGSPAPINTRARNIMVLAGAVGLMFAAGLVLLIEYLDDTIKSGDELSKQLGIMALGSIARLKGRQPHERLIASLSPFDPIVEAYRMVRSNIRFKTIDKPAKLIMVTSSIPGEGKSTTAANLGIVMAQSGVKTIIVDADLRRPMQQYIFQVPTMGGLTELLVSPQMSLVDQLSNTQVENLQILPCGSLPPNPSELLETERMGNLIKQLKEMADVVIFDSPPVLAVTDAPILATRIDGVILVTDAGKTRRDAIQKSLDTLSEAKANVLGAILNRVKKKKGGYSYQYQGYYAASRPQKPAPLMKPSHQGQVVSPRQAPPVPSQKGS